MNTHRIRVGIDVGGTFTDAVAVDATTLQLLGQVKVPTSHHHEDGVAHGIVEALDRLLEQTGHTPEDVTFLAHGTTQATNALLEGDVATVGLVGIGTGPGATLTRRLAAFRKLELTPGKRLPLAYAHVADPDDAPAVRAALDAVVREGAEVVVASQPFSVDRPEGEEAVAVAARERGLPTTAAHDITSLYGLHKRTRTAVVNAAILPRMLATADLVDASITKAGVSAPLMVMRCDGGVMSLDEMRRRPLLTVLSGPAAGVAGALMQERVSEGLFLETGGTSTDISVVRRGKVAVRHATMLGRSSYLSALDVRTVGVGGGSMVRIDGGKVVGVGPRSAHIAGLPYACFASAEDLRDARVTTIRPMADDPADYAVLDAAGGRFAITMTCAANALGRAPEGDFARCDQEVARAALAPLAAALGTDVATAATKLLDAGTDQVKSVVETMMRDYRLEKDTAVLVGGGGGAASVTPHLAAVTGQEGRIARHNEVISPIGVALALIREQVERIIPGRRPGADPRRPGGGRGRRHRSGGRRRRGGGGGHRRPADQHRTGGRDRRHRAAHPGPRPPGGRGGPAAGRRDEPAHRPGVRTGPRGHPRPHGVRHRGAPPLPRGPASGAGGGRGRRRTAARPGRPGRDDDGGAGPRGAGGPGEGGHVVRGRRGAGPG
ncbi:N-methylhydantoinase A/oxoprolinase/acetone carboxylase, beta subunit, partial [Streptomyces sp. Ncost-T6T-2b]